MSQATARRVEQLSLDEQIALSWETGDTWWLLHEHQQKAYWAYRKWCEVDPELEELGQYARIFGLECGKRYGKTTLRFQIRDEDCRRNPGHNYRYTSAFQKNIDEIVGDVSRMVLETCPQHLRPVYKKGSSGTAPGFYYPNGSILRLYGLDKNPDGLRGRASDGDDISEAAFVTGLKYSVKNVLYHQYQGRPHARMCMESSAPVEVDHDFDAEFMPDCRKRNAYFSATIDDNPRLSAGARAEFIRAAGGRGDPDCEREYYNARTRLPALYLLPEFSLTRHVVPLSRQLHMADYARAFTAMDPGYRDKLGVLWAHWDWRRAKLVIQKAWSKRACGTPELANVLRTTEHQLWRTGYPPIGSDDLSPTIEGEVRQPAGKLWRQPVGSLTWWDGEQLQANPVARWMDVDLTLAADLAREHGIVFQTTEKPVGAMEADINSLRTAFSRDQIEIRPEAMELAECLHAARWNKNRTDWERTEAHGHFDLLATLVYLWRNLDRGSDPRPPLHFDRHDIDYQDSVLNPRTDDTWEQRAVDKLYPGEREWRDHA